MPIKIDQSNLVPNHLLKELTMLGLPNSSHNNRITDIRSASLSIKKRLKASITVTMVLVNYPSAALVEHVALLGFDIAFIDCEKGIATTEHIESMCRGARAAGIATVVRPWSDDPGLISRYLDIGADGVMVAGIDTPEAAQKLVDIVQYARWKDHANKLIFAMIESPTAIDRLPELLAVQGIDVWFIGVNDLAHRMGFPGGADLPEVRKAVFRTLSAIRDAGRVGGVVVSGADVTEFHDAGARLLMTRTSDLLSKGADLFHSLLPGGK